MPDIPRPSRAAVTLCATICIVVSSATVLLRGQVAFYIALSPFDDYHFVRQAAFLSSRQWLGPYDKLTLAKGPSYPVFIAVTHMLGMDLKVGEQLTLIAAAIMVALSVWMVTRRLWLTTAVYLVMALNPISFTLGSAGVLRDGWYASLCILFPAAVFVAVYGALNLVRWVWWLGSSILAGVSGATMLLCREEGVGSLPPALVVAAVLPLALLADRIRRTPKRRRRWGREVLRGWRSMVAVAAVGVSLVGPILFVSVENQRHYGVALTNDSAAGTFVAAYGEWSRVKAGTPRFEIPINKAQRLAVYVISPAARELEPWLENPKNRWLHCDTGPCDFPGAFTIWAIRDAAAAAGHFIDAPDTQAFFGELAGQIRAGCQNKALNCSTGLPGALQPITQAPLAQLWSTAVTQLEQNLRSDYFVTPALQRTVPARAFEDYANVADDSPADAARNADRNTNAQTWHWLFEGLFRLYRILIPLLVVLGLGGLIAGAVRPLWPRSGLAVLAAAMLVGLLARLATLALVQVTQFRTEEARYQVTTQMFMITMAVVGAAALADQWAVRRAAHRRAVSAPALDAGSALIDPREAEGEADHDQLQTAEDQHRPQDR